MFRFVLSIFIFLNFAITSVFAQEGILIPQSVQNTGSYQQALSSVACSQNYFTSVLSPSNKVIKWQKMPINIYIQNDKYIKVVESAFEEWEISTDKTIIFNRVDSVQKSDISVLFIEEVIKPTSGKYYQAGFTKPSYKNGNFAKVEIFLLKKSPISKKPFTESQMRMFALHEIGHSIGIEGHSPNTEDIMYCLTSHATQGLSSKDINTLKMVYSPESSNIKIEPYVINQRIKEAKSYNQQFPESFYGCLRLADLYRANGDYGEAINGYKKAVAIDKSCSQAYYAMGICYYRMKNYQLSLKNYSKALDLEPENQKFIHSYIKVCFETNNREKASQYLANYLKKYPNSRNDTSIQSLTKMLKPIKH